MDTISEAIKIARRTWRIYRHPGLKLWAWFVLAEDEPNPSTWTHSYGLSKNAAYRELRQWRIGTALTSLGLTYQAGTLQKADLFADQRPGRWEHIVREIASRRSIR